MLAVPAILHAPEGNATINNIARELGTTKQSTTQIVNAMGNKGYVSVAPNEKDKRAVNISITPEGMRSFRVCSERTDEFLADVFNEFTADELETLCTLLEKLYCFDGIEPVGIGQHLDFNPDNSDEIMERHRHFQKNENSDQKNTTDPVATSN